MMQGTILKPLTAAIAAASLVGCFSGSSSDSTGSLSLDLTDAPTHEFTEVNITFTGVSLQPADGQRLEFEFDEPKTINLLELQGGETANFLNDETVPAGDYEWMRLELDMDNLFVETIEGGEETLFVPSGAQTGLQTSGFTVAAGSNTNYTIDFDVQKSLVNPQGNQQADYFLKPVLRLVDNLEVGSIAGTVDYDMIVQENECADMSEYLGAVYVHEGEDATVGELGSDNEPLVTAHVLEDEEEEGRYIYKAAFLPAGDYKVSYSCQLDDNEEVDDIEFIGTTPETVEAETEKTVNF